MRLLEVVRGEKTAKDVLATTMKLGKTLKKVPVVSGVCDGFIGNRMLEKYGQQSLFLLDEGATPQQVDARAAKLRHGDGAVRDVRHGGQRHRLGDPQAPLRRAAATCATRRSPTASASRAASARRPARAATVRGGQPQADSRPGGRDRSYREYRKELGIERRAISDEEIVERCIYALVNEGAKILEEGIALRASDIDMVYLTGYGFPPYRGGPMFYADTVGLDKVLESIEAIQERLSRLAVASRRRCWSSSPRKASASTREVVRSCCCSLPAACAQGVAGQRER